MNPLLAVLVGTKSPQIPLRAQQISGTILGIHSCLRTTERPSCTMAIGTQLHNFDLQRVMWDTQSNNDSQYLHAIHHCRHCLFGLYHVDLTRSWYHNETRQLQLHVKCLEMAYKESEREGEGEGVLPSIPSDGTGKVQQKAKDEEKVGRQR